MNQQYVSISTAISLWNMKRINPLYHLYYVSKHYYSNFYKTDELIKKYFGFKIPFWRIRGYIFNFSLI